MSVVLSLKKKERVNLNDLAQKVAQLEGGKQQLSIAQVKEVMRHTLDRLAIEFRDNPRGVVKLLEGRKPVLTRR